MHENIYRTRVVRQSEVVGGSGLARQPTALLQSFRHPREGGDPLLFRVPKVSGTPAFAGVTGVDGVRSVLVGPVPLRLRLLASFISHLADAERGGYLVPIVP